jgi:predicted Zn-dependent peptidase
MNNLINPSTEANIHANLTKQDLQQVALKFINKKQLKMAISGNVSSRNFTKLDIGI